jgi:GAF domain-containing protein
MKARHPRTTKPKRRKESTARRRDSSATNLQKQLDQRTRERDEARKHLSEEQRHLAEALEQQTATSEVLQIISSSPGELKPVFQAILENATRLCAASYGVLWLREGDAFRNVALHGAMPNAYAEEFGVGTLFRPSPQVPFVLAVTTGQPVHVADLRASPGYLAGDPLPLSAANTAGVRTLVAVPMLKESESIGVIVIFRKEVRPFTAKQIELVSNFARQSGSSSCSWVKSIPSPTSRSSW